jgi:hypothetical protein
MLICLNQELRAHGTKITAGLGVKNYYIPNTLKEIPKNSFIHFWSFVSKFKMFILLWYNNLLVSVFLLLCHALGLQHLASWVHNLFQINQIRAYHSQRKSYMSVLRRNGEQSVFKHLYRFLVTGTAYQVLFLNRTKQTHTILILH